MCGIAAIYRPYGPQVDLADIKRMSSVMRRRGPDERGIALMNEGRVGFGFVRLSINDLITGQQPIHNEDYSLSLIFQGELYDHRALRHRLEKKGHRFRSQSDSEVAIHLYEEFGEDFLSHINGEFSLALWDSTKKTLLMARDRFGIKPLFIHQRPIENGRSEWLISSEVKGIFALSRVHRAIAPEYLTGAAFGVFPAATSAFDQITSLKPGYLVKIDALGDLTENAYWQCNTVIDPNLTFEDARNELRSRLERAVNRRMEADVRVGCFLSGGVDSSIICNLASRRNADLQCFHVGFQDAMLDESEKAQRVANSYGVPLHLVNCTNEDLAAHLPNTIEATETVLINPHAVARLSLSRLANAHGCKVCLTGEGADELFAGYSMFKLESIWRLLMQSGSARHRGQVLADKLRSEETAGLGILWEDDMNWKNRPAPLGWPSFLHLRALDTDSIVRTVFCENVIDNTLSPSKWFASYFDMESLKSQHPLNASRQMSLHQLSSYLLPNLGDRVEMWNAVEGRQPFLDHEVADLCFKLKPEFLLDLDKWREKAILYSTFGAELPDVVTKSRKHPFFAPGWHALMNTKPGRQIQSEYLSSEALTHSEIFNARYVSLLLKRWLQLPDTSAEQKKLDRLAGLVLCCQILYKRFVECVDFGDPRFAMIDRSPP